MDDEGCLVSVQVCWASPERVILKTVQLDQEGSVARAIELSGVVQDDPAIDLSILRVAVFGKVVALDARLHAGDRVEILRPLLTDPKDARRRRAVKAARSATVAPKVYGQ